MSFPQWPKSKKEEGPKDGISPHLFELVGSGDQESIRSAVERLRTLAQDLPRSGRSLDASSREFVIPISSHEQKEAVLDALYDLSIFPWEENGQFIIERPADLLKLRAAGFEPESLPVVSVPAAEASLKSPSENAFPVHYPETLSATLKRRFVPTESTQTSVRGVADDTETDIEPGLDTELEDIVNKFDEGRIDEDDVSFKKRVGILPTMRLFPHAYIWKKGKVHEKRTGREISKDEQLELYQKAREGDPVSIATLVRMNTGLVLKVVVKYVEKFGGDPDDLFQEGMIGLVKAVHDHDETRGSFSTYAMIKIESQVRRAGYEGKEVIHRPVNVGGLASQLRKAKEKVSMDGELRPEDVFDEIPEHRTSSGLRKESKIPTNGIGLDRLERLYFLNAAFDPVSLEEGTVIDAQLQPHGILEDNTDTEDAVLRKDIEKLFSKVLLSLTPREERILRMRFGLQGQEEKTLLEIGDEMGVSGGRIMQIEAKALRRLKHPSRSRALRWLLERPIDKDFEDAYYPPGF